MHCDFTTDLKLSRDLIFIGMVIAGGDDTYNQVVSSCFATLRRSSAPHKGTSTRGHNGTSAERCKNSSRTENGPVEQKGITFNVRSAKFKSGKVFDFHRFPEQNFLILDRPFKPSVIFTLKSRHSGRIKDSLLDFMMSWLVQECPWKLPTEYLLPSWTIKSKIQGTLEAPTFLLLQQKIKLWPLPVPLAATFVRAVISSFSQLNGLCCCLQLSDHVIFKENMWSIWVSTYLVT